MSHIAQPEPADPAGGLLALAPLTSPRLRKIASTYVMGAAIYKTGKSLYHRLRNERTHTVTLDSRDDLYPDVMAWLYATIPEERRRSLRATSSSTSRQVLASPEGGPRPEKPKLNLHYDGTRSQKVTIDGHRIVVEVETETDPGRDSDGAYSYKVDKITFTAADIAGRAAVLEFLAKAAESRVETGPRLYIATRWGDWMRSGGVPLRDFATVALPDGVVDDMIADLTRFFSQEADYNRLGLPWHRGYILQGPPGTGKTTIAKALAAKFDLDVYFVPLADIEDDSSLLRQFANLPQRSLLLLEDIDISAAAKERTDQNKGVSMSALLQALDGVVSPHGIVTVMTTNHVEDLDDALVRAGRADRIFPIGYLTDGQLTDLVESLIGVRRMFRCVDGLDIAPSDIVEVLKAHIGQPALRAVDAVDAYIKAARAAVPEPAPR